MYVNKCNYVKSHSLNTLVYPKVFTATISFSKVLVYKLEKLRFSEISCCSEYSQE